MKYANGWVTKLVLDKKCGEFRQNDNHLFVKGFLKSMLVMLEDKSTRQILIEPNLTWYQL